jgi:hypothetical protein
LDYNGGLDSPQRDTIVTMSGSEQTS